MLDWARAALDVRKNGGVATSTVFTVVCRVLLRGVVFTTLFAPVPPPDVEGLV